MLDETLVKEEIVDTVDDSRDDGLDSGMDYGALGADSRVGGSSDGMGADHTSQMLPNKFDQPMVPTQQHLPDSVTEALAGPSGMQGVRFTMSVCVVRLFIPLIYSNQKFHILII